MGWLIGIGRLLLRQIPLKAVLAILVAGAIALTWYHVNTLTHKLEAAELALTQEQERRVQVERTMRLLNDYHRRTIAVLEEERARAEERAASLRETRQRVEEAEDGEVAPVLQEALKGLAEE